MPTGICNLGLSANCMKVLANIIKTEYVQPGYNLHTYIYLNGKNVSNLNMLRDVLGNSFRQFNGQCMFFIAERDNWNIL